MGPGYSPLIGQLIFTIRGSVVITLLSIFIKGPLAF